MSEQERELTTEAVEQRDTIIRAFPVELAVGDGRTIDMRIVPYNTPVAVADPPMFRPYNEVWLPGAFERQVNAAHRVAAWLNVEHEPGIRGIIGHGNELRDTEDALHGSFRVMENADGDKALQLVRDGVLGGISLEARPLKSVRRNGNVERVRAHLQGVALTRTGVQAYKTAEVLAVRTEPIVVEPVENPVVTERLEAIGFQPLHRAAVTSKPWDGAASRFTDEEYQRSCLIDRGGDQPVKQRCSLPVLEPNGDLNTNALGQAAARLNQLAAVTAAEKAAAARKLIRYYRMAAMEPPGSVAVTAKG